jgi:glycosyltransferase involved in cell wall biosynthesis
MQSSDMDRAKLVSIIMPNFNKGIYASEAIHSVLGQSYPHIELIFIDDHSTDGSFHAVKEIATVDSRVVVLTTPARQSGGALARNIGINSASGEFIVFLDSDDWMEPDCISERMEAFETHGKCEFLVFQMGIFFETPGDSDLVVNRKKEKPDLERFFLRDQPWLISGPIWRKAFLQELGGFEGSLQSQQDADLHIRAIIQSENYIHFYGKPKVFYRQNVESVPRSISQSYENILQRSEMLQKHIVLLQRHEMLTDNIKTAIAGYFLDLAQMLRWHKKATPSSVLSDAFGIWTVAFDQQLVSDELYRAGMAYIRFKHNMLWNRFPKLMRMRENRLRNQLAVLIFKPSESLSKTRLHDAID